MHITLRPNEKIYVNGAVLKVDRKVSIELLNDAVFLLEAHVMLEEKATTPLRRLYFIVQLMLMEPHDVASKMGHFNQQAQAIVRQTGDLRLRGGVVDVAGLVGKGRAFEALKVIRALLPIEDEVSAVSGEDPATAVAPCLSPVSGQDQAARAIA